MFDVDVPLSSNGRYLYIGQTRQAEYVGIQPSQAILGDSGYILKTVGDSYYLVGNTDYGSLYAVYGFLKNEFDYEYFTDDSFSLVKKDCFSNTNYDVEIVPDIDFVMSNYGMVYYNKDTTVRERYMMPERSDVFMTINGTISTHNTLSLLPTSKYGSYTDFYTDSLNDICFTAHGNQASFEAMTTAAANEIIEEFKSGCKTSIMTLGQQDNNKTCECSACMAIYNQYGTHSAKAIIFCNSVLEKVYEWFDTVEGKSYKRDFYILLLAYQKFVDAPVEVINGNYVLKDGLTVHPKFGVYLAPISCDFTVEVESKSDLANYINQWAVVANYFAFYSYDTNYHCYLTPFNSLESKHSLYLALDKVNCSIINESASHNDVAIPTGWSLLKIYLESQLRWDVNLDVDVYTEKYFEGVYGDAADTMLDIYNSYNSYWDSVQLKVKWGLLNSNVTNNHMLTNAHAFVWDKNNLLNWLNKYETAFADIEHLKTENPNEYDRISKYIKAERVSTLYLILEIYRDELSSTDFNKYIDAFIADTKLLGINLEKEVNTYTIDALLTRWGVA